MKADKSVLTFLYLIAQYAQTGCWMSSIMVRTHNKICFQGHFMIFNGDISISEIQFKTDTNWITGKKLMKVNNFTKILVLVQDSPITRSSLHALVSL